MGSGYVPLALGGILVVLGLLVLVMAFRGGDPAIRDVVREPVPWRRGGLLVAAILFFGFFVRGLGLGPTLFVTTFIAAMAGHGTGPLKAALTAAGHHRAVPRRLRRPAAAAAAAARRLAGGLTWTASSSASRPRSSRPTS